MLASQDTVLRIALAAMAADPASDMTAGQIQCILNFASATRPLTAEERGSVQARLLAWVATNLPRSLHIIQAQFPGGTDAVAWSD